MRSQPKSLLGRIGPGKWYLHAPHWPGDGTRSLRGRTCQTAQRGFGGRIPGNLHTYRTPNITPEPGDPRPSHYFLNPLSRVPTALLCPPGWRDSHNGLQHLTAPVHEFSSKLLAEAGFYKAHKWHVMAQCLPIISSPARVLAWDRAGPRRSALPSSLMCRDAKVSEWPPAK